MSVVRKKSTIFVIAAFCLLPIIAFSALPSEETLPNNHTLAQDAIARQLGWTESTENYCGGYYVEAPFIYPVDGQKSRSTVEVTGEQGMLSQRGTSVLEGKVSITRFGQQITANKAYLYRDPITGKLNAIDLIGNVHLREPNTLVIGKKGRYHFDSAAKSLIDILYRTTLMNNREIAGPATVTQAQMQKERKISALTAWGKAYEFSQTEPRIYELRRASYSTCPPTNPAWKVKASHIVLNKNTGRGYATHARILIKDIPVFYTPYINFPIDNRRKTGFLYPKFGGSNQWGPYLQTPFYWNMAPNYDMTITPGLLSKRGILLSDNFRYLTTTSAGNFDLSVLPNDRFFADFQDAAPGNVPEYNLISGNSNITQAELNRLLKSSTTRKGFRWRDDSQFNENWSSYVNFSYAGDDYYLRDFGNLTQINENQLLQEGDLYYKNEHWNFTTRVQSYQTLHPVDVAPVQNNYRRFPQLILNGDYPDQALGLEYFINTDVTHFEILKTPGSSVIPPLGDRLHMQPGINLPLNWASAYVNPRFQLALTDYNLRQTTDTNTPRGIQRSVPIFDTAAGVTFARDFTLFNNDYQQTLEPQVYYVYIPYRNQANIPLFDTTVSALNYDQIFYYNRFTGLDRIGDTNQIGVGFTSRLIDRETGLEKIRLVIGDIVYFTDRRVTLCNDQSCSDNPDTPSNRYRLSPVSGALLYQLNPQWKFTANSIWDPITKQLANASVAFFYKKDDSHIVNLGYGYARNGNPFSGITLNESDNNIKMTDFSFVWPVIRDLNAVGRWTQDWNTNHFQNLLYGLQYDTCCWAVRMVGGRTFTNLENRTPMYANEVYVQLLLKGLGGIGPDPSGLLSTVTGYNTQTLFG
ncbi:LPS-assembly protein LptD [Aquicella lusitana]|uniref:LPS-assembly protein LptD n=1 Tax=Aquicella lusitana TaxID=254246 RepID=A0A370GE19_9COXI|nr:LPS assembly protein LptD [Aquicella lusitana]RDI41490.1 LPS-assembly protein [Aquicella lusitana]VVC72616.1 LPS-assembly protein LptD [Aquicella lusitana]